MGEVLKKGTIPPPPPGFVPIEQAQSTGTVPPPPPGFVPVDPEKPWYSKAWDAITTPLLSGHGVADALVNAVVPGGLPSEIKSKIPNLYDRAREVQNSPVTLSDANHPILAGVKRGYAGAMADTLDLLSSFTSPASIALTAAEPLAVTAQAAKVLPATAKIVKGAKALQTAAGVGFGAKGALDVAQNTGKALEGDPDAAQRALQGAAMVVGGAAGVANNTPSPRGALAGRMAEIPPGELFSRGEVLDAARSHGINLDLADATESGALQAVKKANSVSILSKGTVEKNAAKNTAALNEWGDKLLRDTHETDLNQQQTGDLVKKSLLDEQGRMYDQAGQYFTQVDNTIGAAKPDIKSVREIAKQIVKENAPYYNKHPELKPSQAWRTVETLANGDGLAVTPDGLTWKEFVDGKMPSAMKATGGDKAAAMKLLKKQWTDLSGPTGNVPEQPITYTWSELQNLRSDLMKEVQSPDIVGSRSEGWLKRLESAIGDAMDKSAGKLSPIDQELYQKANGIWQSMKGTYDNPQHPFYHIVRALDGNTAGNAASRLKPEFVNQLRDAMGDSFSAYQRDAIARILNPKNGANGFDFANLNMRLKRADVERLSAVLSPDQIRELQLMGKVASKVTADVNPSGTAKTAVPYGEIGLLVNPKTMLPAAAEIGAQAASAKVMTSPRAIDFLTQPAKARVRKR